MNVRLNVSELIGATDGRSDAEDVGGRIAADDRRCRGGLCQQQHVADGSIGRGHKRRLQLTEDARGSGHATSAGSAETGGAGQKIRYRGIPDLSGGRQKAQDAETASAVNLQPDAGRIPSQMGASTRLPDGGAKLRRAALGIRQEDRVGARHGKAVDSRKEIGAKANQAKYTNRLSSPSKK